MAGESPESLLRAGKVKQGTPFPSAKGTAFGTVTGKMHPEEKRGRRRRLCEAKCLTTAPRIETGTP
nr:MAG TPA: hypothetical protein [Caudoviricetes sp.]